MGVKVREKPKGSGEWYVFINHQNKRRAKRIGRDKRVALKVAKEIEARLVVGDLKISGPEDNTSPTLSEYATVWMNTVVPATCKPSTILDYQSIIMYCRPLVKSQLPKLTG